MLTKQDLRAIGNIVDSKLESKLEEKLESKLEEKLNPIHSDIKSIKKDIKKLRSDLTTTIDYFDNQDIKTKKDIQLIQKHLKLTIPDFA